MPAVEKISIALPPEMVKQLRKAVDGGEYASSSEVVREALRDWGRKRMAQKQGLKELRKLWQQALEDHAPGAWMGKTCSRVWSRSISAGPTLPADAH
jgi:antitoxin ParD1/3/4